MIENYANNGIAELESLQVLKNEPFASIGSRKDILRKDIFKLFGDKEGYFNAIAELKNLLYQMTWMIFLKVYDTQESSLKMFKKFIEKASYTYIINRHL